MGACTWRLCAASTTCCAKTSPQAVHVESVGGVDAAKRVQAGEAFDVVVLAADAIDNLVAAGRVLAGSQVEIGRAHV